MNNRAYALLTGLFLVTLTAAVVFAAIWMGGSHMATRPYLVVTTQDVSGLQPHSTIFYRGIAAGTVGSIHLDPTDPRDIVVEANVDTDIPVTRGTFATLKLQGITGQSLLMLDDDSKGADTEPLATTPGAPARIPMRPSLLDTLSSSGAELAQQLQKLTAALNELVDSDNRDHVKHLLAETDEAIGKLTQLESDLDATARKLPDLDRQSQSTLAEMQRAATSIDTLSQGLNRELSAGPDGKSGSLQQLDATLAQIDQAAADVHRLAQNLTADPQRLLYGPARVPGPGEQGYKEPQP